MWKAFLTPGKLGGRRLPSKGLIGSWSTSNLAQFSSTVVYTFSHLESIVASMWFSKLSRRRPRSLPKTWPLPYLLLLLRLWPNPPWPINQVIFTPMDPGPFPVNPCPPHLQCDHSTLQYACLLQVSIIPPTCASPMSKNKTKPHWAGLVQTSNPFPTPGQMNWSQVNLPGMLAQVLTWFPINHF